MQGVKSLPGSRQERVWSLSGARLELLGSRLACTARSSYFLRDQAQHLRERYAAAFPGDAPRFIQRSMGYRATLVNGQVHVRDGECVGIRDIIDRSDYTVRFHGVSSATRSAYRPRALYRSRDGDLHKVP